MPGPADHYAVLGLTPTATADAIKQAYRSKAKQAHPDAGGSAEAMERVNEAYRVLSDPDARLAYDRARTAPQPAPDETAGPGYPAGHAATNPTSAHAQGHTSYHQEHRRRLRAARLNALQIMRMGLMAAFILGILSRFFGSQLTDPATKLVLAILGFLPIYALVVGGVFLTNPQLRLDLYDIIHRHRRPSQADLVTFIGLGLAIIPLGFIWISQLSGIF